MSNENNDKEKYLEALNYLFQNAHSCTNCDKVNIGCKDCKIDNTMECEFLNSIEDNSDFCGEAIIKEMKGMNKANGI